MLWDALVLGALLLRAGALERFGAPLLIDDAPDDGGGVRLEGPAIVTMCFRSSCENYRDVLERRTNNQGIRWQLARSQY